MRKEWWRGEGVKRNDDGAELFSFARGWNRDVVLQEYSTWKY